MTSASTARIASVLPAAALLLAAAAVADWTRGFATARRAHWPAEADAIYLPTADVLGHLSLRHREFMADLVAARTNVYYGTQIGNKGEQRWLSRYLSTVVELDPHFQVMYERGATMLVYNGRSMNADAFLEANALLRRGLERFPHDWRLWYQLGFNELFELPKVVPKDDPRIARWSASGTEALRRATLDPQAPAWLANLVARRMTDEGRRDLAIEHLKRVYAVTSDDSSRLQIRAKLMQLVGAQQAAALESEQRRLRDLVSEYPYAPEAFSIQVGARATPWVDPTTMGAP